MITGNDFPRIALIGYGSMGKEIERIAHKKGITISNIFDIDNPLSLSSPDNFDVAIDFSTPASIIENVRLVSKLQKDIVIGTTGWNDQFQEVVQHIENNSVGAIYGSNYSIGMQMFFRVVRQASMLINTVDEYDIFLHEIHHKRKIDSPSGTALSLADIILEEIERKQIIVSETLHSKINENELHISSVRGGEITGTHTVYVDSQADTIELTHRAKNRGGFALGALEAAGWIWKKKGVYDFTSVFTEILEK
ncbi:MAG: 4-hydroxy-tetrahydrodipicolinate reductase [Ignavibacteriae bacterium]|nr:4-hydroxy-tetrahydrodipicolinate reductase [Ignavibacteriota bacterium]